MTEKPPIRIATISSNPDPNWVWIRDLIGDDFTCAGRRLEWSGFSTAPKDGANTTLARFRGAKRLASTAKQHPFDLIVSHGPWTTAWTEFALGSAKQGARHLAFSFNFTDLPRGARRYLMQRSFQSVDAFSVFTHGEQELYADYFGIDQSKIIRAPWGVAPPLDTAPSRQIDGPYMAALGGEARDYETLCAAARLCPELKFVAIARPHNFDGFNPPENMTVLFNLPPQEAWGIVWHADFALIPLRSQDTPCGLVTLVGGMHLGKAQIVTNAMGVSDYIKENDTGQLVPANDAEALAAAVTRLHQDPALAARLGRAAKTYAADNCSEAATVEFFKNVLERWFG
jgi:glycosyl transferase family 1